MKRTEHFGFTLSKEEKARLRIMASDLHISMSAFCRMKIFTVITQYIPQQKRKLPSIPRIMDMTRGNMVNVIVELKGVLVTRRKMVDDYEENLADEVGIK